MYLLFLCGRKRCIEMAISGASFFLHHGRLRRLVISATGAIGLMIDA
jgi:hypothetical protein